MSMTVFSCRSYFVAIGYFDFSSQSRYAYCRSGSAAALFAAVELARLVRHRAKNVTVYEKVALHEHNPARRRGGLDRILDEPVLVQS
jgi:hypothetical protein